MSEDPSRTAGPVRTMLVGAGHMGTSHGRALAGLDRFELCGIVTRGDSGRVLTTELGDVGHHRDYEQALAELRPDAVVIASYTETHVPYATAALQAGCHVFVEKPLAPDVAGAERLVALARSRNRVLAVGYILRHHPAWQQFIEVARGLGRPLVMRMNLNQQSSGPEWATHRSLMASTSPIVDCGVHYVDVMSQITKAQAVRVQAIGARLSDDLAPDMYNYGQLQVVFDDGSVGWYESGWGPMMSQTAYFVKDVIGPRGSVSIEAGIETSAGSSADVDGHTAAATLRIHHGELDAQDRFARPDDLVATEADPSHDELCRREIEWFGQVIDDPNLLGDHLDEVVDSLRIVLAADQSIATGRTMSLEPPG